MSAISKKKSAKQQHKKSLRKCTFCKSLALSREHLFPRWLASVIPKTGVNWANTRTSSRFDDGEFDRVHTTSKLVAGASGSYQIRVVCKECNNEWMSRLENEVKPTLTPLMLGEKVLLSPDDQLKLASWICKTSIIFDQDSIPHNAVSEEFRTKFRNQLRPDESWKIWIGTRSSWSEDMAYRGHHTGFGLAVPYVNSEGYEILGARIAVGVQSSLFCIGSFVAYAVSCDAPGQFFPRPSSFRFMHRIWPPGGKEMEMPNAIPLNDQDIDELNDALTKTMGAYRTPSSKITLITGQFI